MKVERTIEDDDVSANKIFRENLNFVYEELLNQFLNNNGYCKNSTFLLINWAVIFDDKIEGRYY